MNELQTGVEFSFAVLPEPSALFQPSKGAFDDTAFGQHSEGMQFIAFADLHGSVQSLFDAVREWLSGVTVAGETSRSAGTPSSCHVDNARELFDILR